MNFQQLRIIREAVRQDFNLTTVAGTLFTSQPGVSKHIKDLEDELGVEIFVRRGKRLLHTDGSEMRAAHLSRFLFENERDGAALLEQAARRCAREGVPVLFTCLPESAAQRLLPHLRQVQVLPAPATVYGVGFPPAWTEWWVDSAEI